MEDAPWLNTDQPKSGTKLVMGLWAAVFILAIIVALLLTVVDPRISFGEALLFAIIGPLAIGLLAAFWIGL